jgi:hypothetical protein
MHRSAQRTTNPGVVSREITTPPAEVALTPCRDSSGSKSFKKKEITKHNEGSGAWSCDLFEENLTHWPISIVGRRPWHHSWKCAVET